VTLAVPDLDLDPVLFRDHEQLKHFFYSAPVREGQRPGRTCRDDRHPPRYNYLVNQGHLQFLASPEWARMLESELLPWVEAAGNLGDDVLEIGPGPGLTTDLLRRRVSRVTAVEVDPNLGQALKVRLASGFRGDPRVLDRLYEKSAFQLQCQ